MKKHVIVTGGAQGIGKITVLNLLKSGFLVTVFELDKEAISEFESELNHKTVCFLQVNVSDEEQV